MRIFPAKFFLPFLGDPCKYTSIFKAPAGLQHQNPEHSKENCLVGERNVRLDDLSHKSDTGKNTKRHCVTNSCSIGQGFAPNLKLDPLADQQYPGHIHIHSAFK